LKTELEKEKVSKSELEEVSSEFYTVIPHNFGRKKPTPITSLEGLKEKVDLLNVLSDIEIAQGMKSEIEKNTKEEKNEEEEIEEIENPIDLQYQELKNNISIIEKNSDEFKILEKFYNQTKEGGNMKIKHIYKIDRNGEKSRHDQHKDISNRKLLWHGTNVAVCSAILKTGLRIMPHSGGRVGRGLYFASENNKSAGYVQTAKNNKGKDIGIMFLNEVALGKENHIQKDDSSLKKPPNGYDSVVALGQREPDKKI